MYTRFDTMRDLERTPLLSQDVVVLSEKVKAYHYCPVKSKIESAS